MAGSVNKVIIVGNLGRDPEIRVFPNGGRACNMRVVTSEVWRDRETGERRERAEWHKVTLRSEHHVKLAEQYLHKGSKVYIEGQLETRKWQDQSGYDRFTTYVEVRPFKGDMSMLDKREHSLGGYGDDRGAGQSESDGYAGGVAEDSRGLAAQSVAEEIDDSIPY